MSLGNARPLLGLPALFRRFGSYCQCMQLPSSDLLIKQGENGTLPLKTFHGAECGGRNIDLKIAAFACNADFGIRVDAFDSVDQILFIHHSRLVCSVRGLSSHVLTNYSFQLLTCFMWICRCHALSISLDVCFQPVSSLRPIIFTDTFRVMIDSATFLGQVFTTLMQEKSHGYSP